MNAACRRFLFGKSLWRTLFVVPMLSVLALVVALTLLFLTDWMLSQIDGGGEERPKYWFMATSLFVGLLFLGNTFMCFISKDMTTRSARVVPGILTFIWALFAVFPAFWSFQVARVCCDTDLYKGLLGMLIGVAIGGKIGGLIGALILGVIGGFAGGPIAQMLSLFMALWIWVAVAFTLTAPLRAFSLPGRFWTMGPVWGLCLLALVLGAKAPWESSYTTTGWVIMSPFLLFPAVLVILAGNLFPMHRRLRDYWRPTRLPRLRSCRSGLRSHPNCGVTLIELLIQVAILSILVVAVAHASMTVHRAFERQEHRRAAVDRAQDHIAWLRAQPTLPALGTHRAEAAWLEDIEDADGGWDDEVVVDVRPGPTDALREVRVTVHIRGAADRRDVTLAALLPVAAPTPEATP